MRRRKETVRRDGVRLWECQNLAFLCVFIFPSYSGSWPLCPEGDKVRTVQGWWGERFLIYFIPVKQMPSVFNPESFFIRMEIRHIYCFTFESHLVSKINLFGCWDLQLPPLPFFSCPLNPSHMMTYPQEVIRDAVESAVTFPRNRY